MYNLDTFPNHFATYRNRIWLGADTIEAEYFET